jgi:hypothetical protein
VKREAFDKDMENGEDIRVHIDEKYLKKSTI